MAAKKKRQCQALSPAGVKCGKIATEQNKYHGDNEIYDFDGYPQWVLVWLCNDHLVERKSK